MLFKSPQFFATQLCKLGLALRDGSSVCVLVLLQPHCAAWSCGLDLCDQLVVMSTEHHVHWSITLCVNTEDGIDLSCMCYCLACNIRRWYSQAFHRQGSAHCANLAKLSFAIAGKPKLVDFDPFAAQPKMSYKDGYQKQYFVLNSFKEGAKQLLDYCLSITDPDVVTQHLQNLNRLKKSS